MFTIYRKRSSRSDKFAVSANMAYGQVNMTFGITEREYENPDRSGQCTDTMTTATRSYETTTAAYETVDIQSSPRVPEYVYVRTDEAVRTTSEQ